MTKKNKNRKTLGFTLAEVLITLAIIGVVAVLTVPNLVKNINQRDWAVSASTFNRRFGEAIRIMNAQRLLTGYSSTEDFVNELSNHIKILKVCKSDELTDCFADTIIKDDEGNSLDVSTINVGQLGHSDYKEIIGVQFTNGVNALIAYNPKAKLKEDDNVVKFVKETQGNLQLLKIGGGFDTLSIVYDVNGFEKPNTVGSDIRSINSSLSGGKAECTPIGNGKYCIWDVGTAYEPMSCNTAMQGYEENDKYCGTYSGSTKDYWAGARKLCDKNGMRLATLDELEELHQLKLGGVEGIPSGTYWAFKENGSQGYIYSNSFGTSWQGKGVNNKALCIGN